MIGGQPRGDRCGAVPVPYLPSRLKMAAAV
jgi:hypothetical protein